VPLGKVSGSRSFSADPRLSGYAHGFMEKTINGHRVLMHDGGRDHTHTIEAVRLVVPALREAGYALETVSTLLR